MYRGMADKIIAVIFLNNTNGSLLSESETFGLGWVGLFWFIVAIKENITTCILKSGFEYI